MTAKSADDIFGTEYDWLACDADGHVALFSTAGGGYAPAEFLHDTDAHDRTIETILALPPSTAVRFAPELDPTYSNTWRMVAERGLYAFDGDFSRGRDGPYRLDAAPEDPIHVSWLPTLAADVVQRLQLPLLRFAQLSRHSEVPAEILRSRGLPS